MAKEVSELNSGKRFSSYHLDARRKLLKSLLIAVLIVTSCALSMNVLYRNYSAIYMNLLLLACGAGLLVRAWRATDIARVSLLLTVSLGSVIALIQYGNSTQYPAILVVWLFLLPPIYTHLMGAKKGLVLTIVILSLGFLGAFTTGIEDLLPGQPWRAVVNICLISVSISAIAYFSARERDFVEQALRALANTDPLTNLKNRNYFTERFRQEFSRSGREEVPLSLILLDLDNFKLINDSYGHAGGDASLVATAAAIVGSVRDQDVVARMGGEEFMVLVMDTDQQGAAVLAENLRGIIEATLVPELDNKAVLTASFGVAQLRSEDACFEPLYRRADIALYHAKKTGRNKVVAFSNGLIRSRESEAVA